MFSIYNFLSHQLMENVGGINNGRDFMGLILCWALRFRFNGVKIYGTVESIIVEWIMGKKINFWVDTELKGESCVLDCQLIKVYVKLKRFAVNQPRFFPKNTNIKSLNARLLNFSKMR